MFVEFCAAVFREFLGSHDKVFVCNAGDSGQVREPRSPSSKGESMSRPVEVPHSSAHPSLSVSHRDAGDGVCVVSPAGEVDLATAPRLKSSLVELLEEGFTHFVLDLSTVRYLDSTGLGILIGFARRLPEGGQILLAQVPASVVGLLELTGLDAQFTTCDHVEDALAQVRGDGDGSAQAPLCPDAEIALGLAATALPFAESSADELRRWVRILSAHGEAGRAFQRAGLTEATLELPVTAGAEDVDGPQTTHVDSVTRVRALATAIAADREAATIGTVDLLLAVMTIYGDAFDDELQVHGTTSIELIECLGTSPDPVPVS
jgi:anti-sigma B factor antagonist